MSTTSAALKTIDKILKQQSFVDVFQQQVVTAMANMQQDSMY